MKIDTGPFLNGELSITNNAVTVKNCDDFVWTKIRIGLNYYDYECNYSKDIQPNETCIIDFSNFVLCYDYLADIMPAQFDGEKTRPDERMKPHYQITFEADEGHNYVDLLEKNKVYTMSSKRENVIVSHTIE